MLAFCGEVAISKARFRHLGRIFAAEPLEAELVLSQGVAHGGAQQIAALRIVERLPVAPALAVEQLDLLGRLAPALARPHDVRAQPDRHALLDIRDDLERDVVPPGIRQGARLEQQALIAQLIRELGGARRIEGGNRPVGLAIHQVDDREPRRHLGARGPLQAMVDLVLQQFGRLVEEIDRHQPIGHAADHLVAAPSDRRQLTEVVEQAERVDRRHGVAPAREEQRVE